MKKLRNEKKKSLVEWFRSLPENDCSFAVDARDALQECWREDFGGKCVFFVKTAFFLIVLVAVVVALSYYFPTINHSR
jgi:hypothetical protein